MAHYQEIPFELINHLNTLRQSSLKSNRIELNPHLAPKETAERIVVYTFVFIQTMSCLQLQLLNLDERITNLRRPLLWPVCEELQKHQQTSTTITSIATVATTTTTHSIAQEAAMVVNNLRDRHKKMYQVTCFNVHYI